jgi:hypothetical protein
MRYLFTFLTLVIVATASPALAINNSIWSGVAVEGKHAEDSSNHEVTWKNTNWVNLQ